MAESPQSNGFDGDVLRSIVGRIEACLADLLSERGAYMARCRGIRESMAAVYDDAKARDIPQKALRALIKTRILENKVDAVFAALERDEQADYNLMQESFDTTPLGQAAAKSQNEARDGLMA